MISGLRRCVPLAALALCAAISARAALVQIPAGHDSDLRVFLSGGRTLSGPAALERMQSGVDLDLWVAGNQYFAMGDVLRAFQKENPKAAAIGVITLPPGLIAQAILKGGWRYAGKSYPMRPDAYATVDLAHLRALKKAGLASDYRVYLHNELALMVARGNPKDVHGLKDLRRTDLRVELPNPVDEGIMSVYGRKVLERLGLWKDLTAGQVCRACRPVAHVYFTAVHHREIPADISAGRADVGLVWKTEIRNAAAHGLPIAGVDLPPQDSLRDQVSYLITPITGARHAAGASAFLRFLETAPARDAYAAHGFVPARSDESEPRPIR
ncbi:MAG: substrate-binding domain-containing protein [Elusimicrobia bacterium]|nr:substrate-binding domain-containing protein [Elusimicrobiota bacterium]